VTMVASRRVASRNASFRLRVLRALLPGFATREVIAPGDDCSTTRSSDGSEDDGTLYFKRPWSAARPHDVGSVRRPWVDLIASRAGAVLTRLIEPVRRCPRHAVSHPPRAPAWFGAWEGDIFFPGQAKGGREGALSGHRLYPIGARAKPSRTSSSKYLTQAPLVVAPGGDDGWWIRTSGHATRGCLHLPNDDELRHLQNHARRECTPLIITEDVFGKP